MSPGIPPSLDRRERQVRLVAGSVLLAVCFFMMLYLTVFRERPDGGAAPAAGSGSERLRAYLDEEERASAYAVLRQHMDQKRHEPGIDAVFCRDSSHRLIEGGVEFHGEVDFQRPNGDLARHTYFARLLGSGADGWTVETVEIREPPR